MREFHREPCKTVEEVLERYRGPMLQRSTVYESDMRLLVTEIDGLRAAISEQITQDAETIAELREELERVRAEPVTQFGMGTGI